MSGDGPTASPESSGAHSNYVRRDRRHAGCQFRRDRRAHTVDVHAALSCSKPLQQAYCSPMSGRNLRVIGASTDQVELLELFQIQNARRPLSRLLQHRRSSTNYNLAGPSPWPLFAVGVHSSTGIPRCVPVPLRLQDAILGCLNLFMSEPVGLSDAEIALAQALADVASIAIVQDQATPPGSSPRRPSAACADQSDRDRTGRRA